MIVRKVERCRGIAVRTSGGTESIDGLVLSYQEAKGRRIERRTIVRSAGQSDADLLRAAAAFLDGYPHEQLPTVVRRSE